AVPRCLSPPSPSPCAFCSSAKPSGQSDSAAQLRTVLSEQGVLLGRHDATNNVVLHQLNSMLQYLHQMANQIQTLQDRFPPANPAPAPVPAPTLASTSAASAPPLSCDVITPTPEHYSGELEKSKGFLLQCTLAFRRSPRSFPDDLMKRTSYIEEFIDLFKQTFCPKVGEEAASKRIWNLRQGNRSVADFAIDFRTIGTESGWNEPALTGAFQHALNDKLKDEQACRDEPGCLDELINLAIKIDNRVRDRSRPSNPRPSLPPIRRGSPSPDSPNPPIQNPPEPMQVGRARLSPEEWQSRISSGCCLYCGRSGGPGGRI
uniref:Retrotransposon gag domain-containing protein n=1 Tax=Xiphophorus maculatus TaxID=8083 RepID=A0A3B5QIN5_XIPMA